MSTFEFVSDGAPVIAPAVKPVDENKPVSAIDEAINAGLPNVNTFAQDQHELDATINDLEAITTVYEQLTDTDHIDMSDVALTIAAESIFLIGKRYRVDVRSVARESFSETLSKMGQSAREALVAKAKEATDSVLTALGKRMRNTMERFKLQMRIAFRFDETWRRESRKIVARAKAARGAKIKDGAVFENRIKVAHLTDGEFVVHTKASELIKDFETTYKSFDAIAEFLREFKKIFDFKNKTKGEFNFTTMASKLIKSSYEADHFSLSGNLALFGEDYSVTEFGGRSANVEQMASILSAINFKSQEVWRVGDLQKPKLKPMESTELTKEAEALGELSEIVYQFFSRWNQEIGVYLGDALEKQFGRFWMDLDFWKSPKLFLFYSRLYTRVVIGFAGMLQRCCYVQGQTLMCLQDYYNWSLDQHVME